MLKPKYIPFILFFLILFAATAGFFLYRSKNVRLNLVPFQPAKIEKKPEVPVYDRAGEEIVYSVTMGKLPLGTAIFTCLPNVQEKGRVLAVMSFDTRVKALMDKEVIYSDARILMPVRVERDIKSLFNHEEIIEEYDHVNFTVTVIKKADTEEGDDKEVFKKDSPIQNPILLPHYVRLMPELKIGQKISVNLAKRSYEMKLVSLEDIVIKAGTFKTYHFESTPRQIEIWLTADKDKIPVKILGLGIFPYALEMNKYTPPKKSQDKPQESK